jgi:spore maturation protein CgeB
MRILLVLGRHNYGHPRRGGATEYQAFGGALRALGHEVVHFESWDRTAWRDFAELNGALFDCVRQEQPDVLVLIPLLYEVWLETLDLIRARSPCRIIVWTTDDSWKYQESSRFYARHCDLITTTYASRLADYKADGTDHVLLTQWAADSTRLRAPRAAAACDLGVTFVGGAHADRRRRIDELSRAGIAVQCFGQGWPSGAVSTEEMLDIFNRSLVSLNFSNATGGRQLKARTFEVPGAGGFLLSEYAPGLEAFYRENDEMLVWRTSADLIEKIEWILARPAERDRMAQAACERTRREHTYEARWREILATAEARRAAPASAGTRPAAMGEAEADAILQRLIAQHRRGRVARAAASAAALPFILVWGRTRGRRAARRAFYEGMRRICGERVYRAAGWPGRLFYRES